MEDRVRFLSKVPSHMPAIQTMFLKREFDLILNFFRENTDSNIPECSRGIHFSETWIRSRVYLLVEKDRLIPTRMSHMFVFRAKLSSK